MSLPLWFLLIPFLGIVLFSGAFLLFNLFDMSAYGIQAANTKAIIYLYITGFLTILLFAGLNLSTVDWTASLDLAGLLPSFTSDNTLGL